MMKTKWGKIGKLESREACAVRHKHLLFITKARDFFTSFDILNLFWGASRCFSNRHKFQLKTLNQQRWYLIMIGIAQFNNWWRVWIIFIIKSQFCCLIKSTTQQEFLIFRIFKPLIHDKVNCYNQQMFSLQLKLLIKGWFTTYDMEFDELHFLFTFCTFLSVDLEQLKCDFFHF